MQAIYGLLGMFLGRFFAYVLAKIGLKVALTTAAIGVWAGLVVTFTTAIYSCISSCGGGVNWGALPEFVRWGLSLVPSNAITVIVCIISANAAGFFAVKAGQMLRLKVQGALNG